MYDFKMIFKNWRSTEEKIVYIWLQIYFCSSISGKLKLSDTLEQHKKEDLHKCIHGSTLNCGQDDLTGTSLGHWGKQGLVLFQCLFFFFFSVAFVFYQPILFSERNFLSSFFFLQLIDVFHFQTSVRLQNSGIVMHS